MFSCKVFSEGNDVLLALCDKDILGKTFDGDDITITVSKDFYGESDCTKVQALKLAKKSTIINAVGNKAVKLLIGAKIVDESSVIQIGGVAHAQVVVLKQ